MNQEAKLNHQVGVQDHIHAQDLFQERKKLVKLSKFGVSASSHDGTELESCCPKQLGSSALREWSAILELAGQ